jgi:hypothetical protein
MHTHENLPEAQALLASVVRKIARHADVRKKLAEGKACRKDFDRPDFVWHELLLSFATMSNSRGAQGLIHDVQNYRRVTFKALKRISTSGARCKELVRVLRAAKVRMPQKKAVWLANAFERVEHLGGPKQAKENLCRREGSEGKIQFWKEFDGIGEKYSRNIMMDVYDLDFRNYIAVDSRINKISRALGVTLRGYKAKEDFYLGVAKKARIEGWDLDRILYRFRDFVLDELEYAENIASARKTLREKPSGDK